MILKHIQNKKARITFVIWHHRYNKFQMIFFNSKPGPETLREMWFNGERIYMITNILRLSIYTSMNHSLLFNPRVLVLQNILRHPV